MKQECKDQQEVNCFFVVEYLQYISATTSRFVLYDRAYYQQPGTVTKITESRLGGEDTYFHFNESSIKQISSILIHFAFISDAIQIFGLQ